MNASSARAIVWMLGLGVVVVCSLSLSLGWIGGNHVLTRVSPNFQALVPSTALAFILLTVALIGIGTASCIGDRVTAWAVWLAVGLVVLNVTVRLFLHDGGLDAFLPFWTDFGDRMSYATAILLILAGGIILATSRTRRDPPLLLTGCALMGLTSIGSIAMSHGLDVNSPYRLSICDGMSLYSLSLFALIFSALLTIHLMPQTGSANEDFGVQPGPNRS